MYPVKHFLAVTAASVALSPAFAETELIMVEEMGCIWCERWNKEVGPGYPNSAEGKAAPLRRIDINAPVPEGLEFERKPRFTPTFILVENGHELGRIEGYPGADFFWPLLGALLAKVEAPPVEDTKAPDPE